ncbi:MAG: hypothetical protein ACJ77V_05205 [Chloroflexota bacterium]
MRRIAALFGLVAALTLMPGLALAARPVAGCPADTSGYFLVDQQTWWDRTVAGFEAEGIAVYDQANAFTAEFDAFAADAGFGSGQGLYDFVWVTQWAGIDKNGDLRVCMKDRPHTPGNPAYFFNGVDNTSR